MAKTCFRCDAEITEDNPVKFCSDCGEEGCSRCTMGESGAELCTDCADEPEEEDVTGEDEPDPEDSDGA